jgi:hypothetical protein
MGTHTDTMIREWQKRVGLRPATGRCRDILDAMTREAVHLFKYDPSDITVARALELLQVITLEQSGIRDGDGCWHGSDPLSGLVDELGQPKLNALMDEYERALAIGAVQPPGVTGEARLKRRLLEIVIELDTTARVFDVPESLREIADEYEKSA